MCCLGLLAGVAAASAGPFADPDGVRDSPASTALGPGGIAEVVGDESERVAARRDAVAEASRRPAAAAATGSAATGPAAESGGSPRTGGGPVTGLAAAAGLAPVHGPALTVELDDAPRESRRGPYPAGILAPGPDDLVVHQQDVQAVVNALWAGGAEAMTIMNRRVTALTAVRCVGNTLLLHGEVFSPPFRITAIGGLAALRSALRDSPQIAIYQQYVAAYRLGYRVSEVADMRMPAYDGPSTLARPGNATGRAD
ncbi:conserved hypothetical protein; putative signal peptide [Frankia alni ACN14a]|uniref:DUF881 domain-containing protein n=1 Tax=Frankia alni (strain DSM 45986 / CECT 9034 / ACN14a) TaxID=326424 RepID=Q0RB08_FRAAA|nr:conserved hypothetical protein; putative signal peptide [Frankia alni ACN14a]